MSKAKSCSCCRAAKAHCNRDSPCSRCRKRHLRCHYRGASANSTTQSIGLIVQNVAGLIGMGDAVATTQQHDPMKLCGPIGLDIQRQTIPKPAQGSEPAAPDRQVDSNNLTDFSLGLHSEWFEAACLFSDTGGFNEIFEMPSPLNITAQSDDNSPVYPPFNPNTSLLEIDPKLTFRTQTHYGGLSTIRSTTTKSFLMTQLLWGQVKSMPEAMIQGQLPPFIYPQCILVDKLPGACVANGVHQCLPEPLANCSSLIRMFYGRTSTSSPLFWDIVSGELKRLLREVLNPDLPHDFPMSGILSTNLFIVPGLR